MGTTAFAPLNAVVGNIIRDTRHYLQSATIQRSFPASPSTLPPIPPVSLPIPPSLFPSLIAVGADAGVAKEMDRVYSTRALELRAHYESSIANACAALASLPLPHKSEKRVVEAFTNLYLTKVRSWIEDGVASYQSRQKHTTGNSQVPDSRHLQRPFNTEYVPLFEHFFDENPFPTHADKVFLAKKSGMTYRQIHVWFQNRRNRTKKQHKVWKKKPMSEGATLPLDSLRERMGRYLVRDIQAPPLQLETSGFSRSNQQKPQAVHCSPKTPHRMVALENVNILDLSSTPAHAFPSPYPPVCTYDPFPVDTQIRPVQESQWPRRPSDFLPCVANKLSVDDLVDKFALLSIRDTSPKRCSRKSNTSHDTAAATHSITIRPPPAPHPALLKPKVIARPFPHMPPFPTIRAPSLSTQVFITSAHPAGYSIPMAAAPTQTKEPGRRKIAPLPKRYPLHLHPYRGVTPATSDASPSPSSSLRSSSASSASSDTCDFPPSGLYPDLPTPNSSPSSPLPDIRLSSPIENLETSSSNLLKFMPRTTLVPAGDHEVALSSGLACNFILQQPAILIV